jgi:hypothetical protein
MTINDAATQMAYEVTVANLYFYQRLVVLADDADVAQEQFEAWLAAPEQQAEEEEEYEMDVQASIDGIIGGSVPQRVNYEYRFHDADVKEFTGNSHWVGTPTIAVQVMSADGNG